VSVIYFAAIRKLFLRCLVNKNWLHTDTTDYIISRTGGCW